MPADLSILSTLGTGVLLGLSAGLSPGPLLTLVVSQSLAHGVREGAKVAMSPLITDLPIILICALVLSRFTDHGSVLGVVSLAGAAFVALLGLSTVRTRGLQVAVGEARPQSLLRGVLVNSLSPHPYIFWLTVGVPVMLADWPAKPLSPAVFLAAFYASLVGAKLSVALVAGKSRALLAGPAYIWLMRAIGVMLLVFAGMLVKDGVRLLGLWGG
jgi:threonine/homoserine/homoserine lactone efflux protein